MPCDDVGVDADARRRRRPRRTASAGRGGTDSARRRSRPVVSVRQVVVPSRSGRASSSCGDQRSAPAASGADLEADEPRDRRRRPRRAACHRRSCCPSTDGCSSSTTSLKKPLTRPSTIFGQRLLGLALLPGGRLGDPALVLDHVGRDVVAGQVLRTHRGDLHRRGRGPRSRRRPRTRPARRPAAAGRRPACAGRRRRLAVEVRDAAASSSFSPITAARSSTASATVLPEASVAALAAPRRRRPGWRRRRLTASVGERLELVVLGHEVGLGAAARPARRRLKATRPLVAERSAPRLAALACAGDPQDLDGLVEVAVGLGQGLLAVHHARRRWRRGAS